ncbi:hypothetical protein BJ742DRAFT_318271 [Cladochytrium replicatum]|nr:hypothetical protein BJ742DRAFT_318271 [Cladochytrium replicatum]
MKRHNGDDWHNFPPCEEDVSDPAYDDNGFGYGFENGKSCLLPLDYCKLYDKWDYCESKGISNGGDSSSDDEDWKNFPPCESEVSDPEYDPNGYGYGFENDKSCLIPLDYCKLYDKWDYCASKDIFATGDDWQHFPPCTGYILNPAKDHNGYRYGQENGHSCLAQWDYCELYGKEYWCEERGVKKGTRVYYCTGPSYVSTTLTTESATQTVTTTTTTTSESVTASESETASMPSGSESASVSTATGASTVTGTSSGTSTRSV